MTEWYSAENLISDPPHTRARRVRSTFPVSSQRPGDAVFDESTNRLLVGTRPPANMIEMDSQTGKEVAKLPTAEGMDGVYFDAKRSDSTSLAAEPRTLVSSSSISTLTRTIRDDRENLH